METMKNDKKLRGQGFLLLIADINTEALIESGIDPENARKISLQAADSVRKAFGGTSVYLPRLFSLEVSKKHWEIFNNFDGTNTFELAKKYDLSIRQIEKILKRCRTEERQKRTREAKPA